MQNISQEKFICTDENTVALQDSVAMRFILAGEAARSILDANPEFNLKYPDFPLEKARGLRNRTVHEYDKIDWEKVWEISKKELPTLIQAVEQLIKHDSDGEEDENNEIFLQSLSF